MAPDDPYWPASSREEEPGGDAWLDRAPGEPPPRLWRSRSDKVVAGVLGGLAEKFGLESRPTRILFSLLTLATGGALAIPYVVLWSITRARGPSRTLPGRWRSSSNKVIAGVLGGLAEKFDLSPNMVRFGYVTLSVFSAGFPGLLLYLILWAMTPEDESRRYY
jgi:phage shock protein C